MSVTELMEWNEPHHRDERLTMMLGMHCAPLLVKDKISNIITIDVRDFAGMKALLSGTGTADFLLWERRHCLSPRDWNLSWISLGGCPGLH